MTTPALSVPGRGVLSLWWSVMRLSLGSSRLVIVVPIYVLFAAVTIIPLGFLAFLILPFNPQISIFDSFIGDFLSAPQGAPQKVFSFFYFYLYLMSYLSIASVMGYEERRDRSIMFWKSLPVSDAMWIVGQVTALFVAFGIGLASLLGVCTVITFWETAYLWGLSSPKADFIANYSLMLNDLASFSAKALLILFLSLPFGISMLWFATFCPRQPGTYWMGTFVSAYLVLFSLRYIGIDFVEPLLWYPESFARVGYWLLGFDRIPQIAGGMTAMVICSCVCTLVFGYLTFRSRRRAMPVA